jgi:hypothetical protein
MLVARRKNHSGVLEWSVDEKLSSRNVSQILETDYVVAGGLELSWIINSYIGVPHHRTCEPQIWTGDIARFIVSHLPTEAK